MKTKIAIHTQDGQTALWVSIMILLFVSILGVVNLALSVHSLPLKLPVLLILPVALIGIAWKTFRAQESDPENQRKRLLKSIREIALLTALVWIVRSFCA
jgi:predicted signal transduction protein with EAL and GGDEF domain